MPRVEFCLALPGGATRLSMDLPEGATVACAVHAALALLPPGAVPADADFGVFGHRRPPAHPLHEGDRVEVLRPLVVDPKIARQRRVEKKRAEKGGGPWLPGRAARPVTRD